MIVAASYLSMYFLCKKTRNKDFDTDLSMTKLKKCFIPRNDSSSLYGVHCNIIGNKVFTGEKSDHAEFNLYVIGFRLSYLEEYAETLRFRKKLHASFGNAFCVIALISLPVLEFLPLILSFLN